MMEPILHPAKSWRRAARHGAGVGAKMTLFYAAAFVLYAIVRSTFELRALSGPDAGETRTLLAVMVSLLVSASTITLLLIPVSALVGMTTALLLNLIVPRVDGRIGIAGTFVTSLAVAFTLVWGVQLVLLPSVGLRPLDLPFETWIFWCGLPTVLYILSVGYEGSWLRSGRPASGSIASSSGRR